jgi:hypothetical protein
MKYLKYFESSSNEDEIIEYLNDILLDIKDTGEWEYNVLNMTDDEHKVKLGPWWGMWCHIPFNNKFDCYKIVLEPTIEYNDDEVGSKIDDTIINTINNCISYMSDYEFEITSTQEGDEHEYSVDDIRELSNNPSTKEPLNYFECDYIIIRFKK